MRALTFIGFLAEYVRELADCETLNIHRLYGMVQSGNHRLKEPLFLYCYYSGRSERLLKYLDTDDKEEFDNIRTAIKNNELTTLPQDYRKVYKAFDFRANRHNNETRIKELMVKKIIQLQKEKNISNYRIYTDLRINPGNFNDFIKNKKYSKLSLKKSREVMNYMEMLGHEK